MLSLEDLQNRVSAAFPDALVEVTTDGYAYTFRVVDETFEGKRPVQRQQLVYATVADLIADGSLHALTIQAISPTECKAAT